MVRTVAMIQRTSNRHHYIQLLLQAAMRMNHCTRIMEYPDTPKTLLLCIESLLMLHHHSYSTEDRETYLDILVSIPTPFPTVLRHLPVFLDILLSFLESSPRQQEVGLQQFLHIAQSVDHDLLVSTLEETSMKERLHTSLNSILYGPSRQVLLDGAYQLLGCLGGTLRSELAVPLHTNVNMESVKGLILRVKFLNQHGLNSADDSAEAAISERSGRDESFLSYDSIIEHAALVLSHSIITPRDKERIPPNPLLLHRYTELSSNSEAYCASLLLHEKQALFQVVLTAVKLTINTEPIAAMMLSNFPCLESDSSFHPNSDNRQHHNHLRILTCCIYCLFLCCLDVDLQEEARKEVEALVDVVVAMVLQYSYQSSSIPPICSKLESNPHGKYNNDIITEMLGPQPPRVGIALSFPSEQNNGDTIISAFCLLCSLGTEDAIDLAEHLFLSFVSHSEVLFSSRWTAFYRMLAFYEELQCSLLYFCCVSCWRMKRAALRLNYLMCVTLPREWTCRFLMHFIRLLFNALNVPSRGHLNRS